jgi:GT2 family glycosyltransferase
VSEGNIILIDDRSEVRLQSYLPKTFSYLRIDNDKGFNFSMLNNIAAKLCFDLGCSEMVLWNSDLWVPDAKTFPNILEKHRKEKSIISGTKLIYPPQEMSLNGEVDTENIRQFGTKFLDGKWRNTVQFGGDVWTKTDHPISYSPLHFKRFSSPNNPFVNCDKPCFFVTGAFQIWNLKRFIELGGLNPSLSKNFQDVDICLRVVKQGHAPLYFGNGDFLYHDESANFYSSSGEKKNDIQMKSDHFLFGKLWKDLGNILYS